MILERTKLKATLLTLIAVSSQLFIGCAKEKPFDHQYREVERMQKSQFVVDENGKPVEYLYVPSTLGAPMDVGDAKAFYQGDEKVVRLQWAEEGLQVLEVERDERFKKKINEHPVLTIPGSFKSFRCAEDAFGDCTNREEENTELEWNQKTTFKPDFEKLILKEVNGLDLYAIQSKSCISKSSTGVLNYEVNSNVINVELEKTYRVNDANTNCIWDSYIEGNLSRNSFKVKFFYSLVRLDKLASPNYKTAHYPVPDHGTFGFFEKEELILNDNFDSERKEPRILMNRWNPKRPNGEIVFHLSPEYSKKANSSILKATRDAVDVMNNEMKKGNINLNIVLKTQPEDTKNPINSGDLRYNSLVLIEDPLANGLLGYGPSVANPYTGEIVQAHTNMYLGVLKGMTRRVYNTATDLTEEEYAKANPKLGPVTDIKIAPTALSNLPLSIAKAIIPADKLATTETSGIAPVARSIPAVSEVAITNPAERLQRILRNHSQHAGHGHSEAFTEDSITNAREYLKSRLHRAVDYKLALKALKVDMKNPELSERAKAEFRDKELNLEHEIRLNELAKNNAFATEFFPIGGTSKVVYPELKRIPGILTTKGTLKRWEKLNSKQRAAAQEIILISSYKATLIHELGHNLGLRHNFTGSYDKANFLTNEEAAALNMPSAPAYSSIMDYSFSEFNQLKAFGKYDIAALRFGYSSEVELTSGAITKVEIPVDAKIKMTQMEPGQALKYLNQHIREVVAEPSTTAFVSQKLQNVSADINSASIKTMGDDAINYRVQSMIKVLKETKNAIVSSTLEQFKQYNKDKGNGITLKQYQFCTDENAGLSPRCNRFDEGTDLVEITKHKIKRYKDAYKYRNFRDKRLKFSSHGIRGYYWWRERELGGIRDIFEEYERFADIFSPELMTQECGPADLAAVPDLCAMVKERRDSVKLISDFFIEILKTPDHQCALATADAPNTVIEYRKLRTLYNRVKGSMKPETKKNSDGLEVVTHKEKRITTSCFDPAIKRLLAQSKPKLLVVGENGKFLNGFKSTDPNYRYVSDRATRGIWADKAIAMKSLFQRYWNGSTSDTLHMALVDVPEVRLQIEMILSHFLQGRPLSEPLPFKTEEGREFTLPYAMVGDDYNVDPVEQHFSRYRRRYGMDFLGQTNLVSMTMRQIQLFGTSYGEDYKESAFVARNLPSVFKYKGVRKPINLTPTDLVLLDEEADTVFVGSDYTPIAKEMISTITILPKLVAANQKNPGLIAKIIKDRQMPEDLTETETILWPMPGPVLQLLFDSVSAGTKFREDQFNMALGPVNGPIISAFLNAGPEGIQKVLEKKKLAETIPVDSSDPLYEVYLLPNQALIQFNNGTYNAEVVNFYKTQIRRMPIFVGLDIGQLNSL